MCVVEELSQTAIECSQEQSNQDVTTSSSTVKDLSLILQALVLVCVTNSMNQVLCNANIPRTNLCKISKVPASDFHI